MLGHKCGGMLPATLTCANRVSRIDEKVKLHVTLAVCRPTSTNDAEMEKPTDLNKYRKKQRKERGSGNALCRSGFHKWQDVDKKQFDVKQGRLVSVQRCSRCNATRTQVT